MDLLVAVEQEVAIAILVIHINFLVNQDLEVLVIQVRQKLL
tara:strand:+ start:404 stop:526 length:123 start_codon:yes stop_codon:yes gene_type:complete